MNHLMTAKDLWNWAQSMSYYNYRKLIVKHVWNNLYSVQVV